MRGVEKWSLGVGRIDQSRVRGFLEVVCNFEKFLEKCLSDSYLNLKRRKRLRFVHVIPWCTEKMTKQQKVVYGKCEKFSPGSDVRYVRILDKYGQLRFSPRFFLLRRALKLVLKIK